MLMLCGFLFYECLIGVSWLLKIFCDSLGLGYFLFLPCLGLLYRTEFAYLFYFCLGLLAWILIGLDGYVFHWIFLLLWCYSLFEV